MHKPDESTSAYAAMLKKAVESLRRRDYTNAEAYILKAMSLNINAAAPQNLLGILLELEGDESNAQRHYRAAYALEPNYKPACRNLERIVGFPVDPTSDPFDYGINEAQPDLNEPTRSALK